MVKAFAELAMNVLFVIWQFAIFCLCVSSVYELNFAVNMLKDTMCLLL